MSAITIVAIVLGSSALLVAFVLVVVALSFRLVDARGLGALAQAMPERVQAHTATMTRQTIQIGGIRYRRCVRVQPAEDGLHLSLDAPWGLLRQERAACIPWGAMHSFGEGSIYLLPARRMLVGPSSVPLLVPYEVFARLEPWLARQAVHPR